MGSWKSAAVSCSLFYDKNEVDEKLSLSAIMVLERVKSKKLFNFRPQGFVDEDIEVYENEKRALRAKQGDCFSLLFSSKEQ